jgi:non-homologous end joining protein Ku
LVRNLSSKHFDMNKYSDSYTEELKKLVEAKSKGKTYAKPAVIENAGTKDLVAALKASLRQTRK